jgi:hypothetical protein
MKINFTIAALLSAAVFLTPVHASTTLFTSTPLLSSTGDICLLTSKTATSCSGATSDYISAVAGYNNAFGSTSPTSTSNITLTETSSNPPDLTGGQLGLGSNGEVPEGDVMILDFSNAKTYNSQSATAVAFNVDTIVNNSASDWVIYGLSSDSSKAATYLASGAMTNLGTITTANLPVYAAYAIGIIGDCEISITGIDVTYGTSGVNGQTPEPGTFTMAGLALIGLGITMKKHRRKV